MTPTEAIAIVRRRYPEAVLHRKRPHGMSHQRRLWFCIINRPIQPGTDGPAAMGSVILSEPRHRSPQVAWIKAAERVLYFEKHGEFDDQPTEAKP